MHELNPTATIIVSGHGGVCGGVAHFAPEGEAKAKHAEGPEEEQAYMADFILAMRQGLIAAGVPEEHIVCEFIPIGKTDTPGQPVLL